MAELTQSQEVDEPIGKGSQRVWRGHIQEGGPIRSALRHLRSCLKTWRFPLEWGWEYWLALSRMSGPGVNLCQWCQWFCETRVVWRVADIWTRDSGGPNPRERVEMRGPHHIPMWPQTNLLTCLSFLFWTTRSQSSIFLVRSLLG